MAFACASCSRKARKTGAKFCHRCGRQWPAARPVLQYGVDRGTTVTISPDDLLYKAVGYRALGALLAFLAFVIMIFWVIEGRKAGEGPGFALLAVALCSVGFFVKSGHYFAVRTTIQRGMRRRGNGRRQ